MAMPCCDTDASHARARRRNACPNAGIGQGLFIRGHTAISFAVTQRFLHNYTFHTSSVTPGAPLGTAASMQATPLWSF